MDRTALLQRPLHARLPDRFASPQRPPRPRATKASPVLPCRPSKQRAGVIHGCSLDRLPVSQLRPGLDSVKLYSATESASGISFNRSTPSASRVKQQYQLR